MFTGLEDQLTIAIASAVSFAAGWILDNNIPRNANANGDLFGAAPGKIREAIMMEKVTYLIIFMVLLLLIFF
jgi:hypothetical protein